MARRVAIREVPHPFKRGDHVVFAGRRCVVKSTSWEGREPYVTVTPCERGETPNLGVPGYRIPVLQVHLISAVDLLGEVASG